MSKIAMPVACAALLFVSCASSPAPAPAAQPKQPAVSAAQTASAPRTVTVRVPLERKSSIRFSDGTLDEYTLSEYDTQGNLISRIRYSASGAFLEKLTWTWSEGKVRQKTIQDREQKLLSRTVSSYNEAGQLVGTHLEDAAGNQLSAYSYTYDAAGNRAEWTVLSGTGKILAKTTYVYANGRIVSAETRDANGNVTGTASYEYNAEGHLVSQKIFDAKGNLLRTESSVWKNGLMASEQRLNARGEPTLAIAYEYGPDRELVRKRVENITGKTSYQTDYEYTIREETRTVRN